MSDMMKKGYAHSAKTPESREDQIKKEIKHLFPGMSDVHVETMIDKYAPYGITAKEEKRKNELEEELRKSSDITKINKFKSLPKEIREAIVLQIEVNEARAELVSTFAAPPEELRELRKKDHSLLNAEDNGYRFIENIIPGISNELLKEAHAETLLLEDK